MGAYPAGAIGHARVNPRNPRAYGICDRCGQRWNHFELRWQFDWRGRSLQNLRILVCRTCLDVPQAQLRSYSPPADPVPILNARPDASAPLPVPGGTYLVDPYGNLQLDPSGNPILNFPQQNYPGQTPV